MVASGYRENTGILKISFASALDLDLNLDDLGLIFEIIEPGMKESSIELTRLIANETEIKEPLFITLIESQGDATGLTGIPELRELNIYRANERIIAELDLRESQSGLMLTVHDLSGRLCNTIIVDNPAAGAHRFSFFPRRTELQVCPGSTW